MPATKNKKNTGWVMLNADLTKHGIEKSFWANLEYRLGKDKYTATKEDRFMALALTLRDRLIERWLVTQQSLHDANLKRVYYLSLEFLVGRLFEANMLNLGLEGEVRKVIKGLGIDLDELMESEADAGLGNGGLGRLASCFLYSMATQAIPAHGYGIRYDYGIFKQKIINGNQVELPDAWLSKDSPWEFARPEYTVRVHFFGRTNMFCDQKGKLRVQWIDTTDVLAKPYDIPIVGYKNNFVNTLKLWSAHSSDEFDLEYFNHGDYERAVHDKIYTETISKVLYPNDNNPSGKILRLAQEYFFCAASLSDIIRRFKTDNSDLKNLKKKQLFRKTIRIRLLP